MLTLLIHKFLEALKQKGLHFLLVGIWNTVFSIGLYTAAVIWLGQRHYLWLSLIIGFIAVVQAYLCHKFFVFKTQGHYLTEFVKFYTVYLVSAPIGLGLMYICVDILQISAVYANILVTGVITIFSFIGHNWFSFRRPNLK